VALPGSINETMLMRILNKPARGLGGGPFHYRTTVALL
jgi:hypothetical protein